MAMGLVVSCPFLLVGQVTWWLVPSGLWLALVVILEIHAALVLRAGLLPRLKNPGTLQFDEDAFALLDGHSSLRSQWSDLKSARLLLPAEDYVPAGFVETVEIHYSGHIARVPWDAAGFVPWLSRLQSVVPRYEVVQPKFSSWLDLGGDL